MDAFNYLSVLISIILGLGITQLLAAVARAVEFRDTRALYWPSIAWFVVLLLAHIQTWWTFYGLREHASWNFAQFLMVLAQPIGLYLLSVLVLPNSASASGSHRDWYFAQRRAFFGLLAIFILLSVLRDFVMAGQAPALANAAFQGLLGAGALLAIWVKHEVFQKTFALVSLSTFVLYIALLFPQLAAQ